MKSLLKLLIRLHPAIWRARYGEEMNALLDDSPPRWIDVADLIRAALAMQLRQLHAAKLAVALMCMGALVALGLARWQTPLYESTAQLKIAPDAAYTRGRVLRVLRVLRPESLQKMLDAYGLYPGLPAAGRIERFRRDIRIGGSERGTWRLSFLNGEPATAKVVTQKLAASFSEEGLSVVSSASDASPLPMPYPRYAMRGLLTGCLLSLCVLFWRRLVPAH